MEPEKTPPSKKPDGPDPFITKAERPDLTVDLNAKVGDLTVRDLQSLLGAGGASPAKLPEKFVIEKPDFPDKLPTKDHKDVKDNKDHKEPKDHADQKVQ
jgi:hypothetical protein